MAGDAIYHEYVDDVLTSGKLPYEHAAMRVPQGPGVGVELDDAKHVEYKLTEQRHRELDACWQEIRHTYAIPPASQDLLVRHF